MKMMLRVLSAIAFVVLIVGLVYFNIKDYKKDSYGEKEIVAEKVEGQVNETEFKYVERQIKERGY